MTGSSWTSSRPLRADSPRDVLRADSPRKNTRADSPPQGPAGVQPPMADMGRVGWMNDGSLIPCPGSFAVVTFASVDAIP